MKKILIIVVVLVIFPLWAFGAENKDYNNMDVDIISDKVSYHSPGVVYIPFKRLVFSFDADKSNEVNSVNYENFIAAVKRNLTKKLGSYNLYPNTFLFEREVTAKEVNGKYFKWKRTLSYKSVEVHYSKSPNQKDPDWSVRTASGN